MYDKYKDKLKRKLYLREYRRKNRIRIYETRRQWLAKTGKRYSKNSDYFRNASPISKISLQRHGLNALKIYEKYNRKCAYCGQDWDLTIHHLDNQGRNKLNKGESPNNNLENLILICRKCHGSIHGKQRGRTILIKNY